MKIQLKSGSNYEIVNSNGNTLLKVDESGKVEVVSSTKLNIFDGSVFDDYSNGQWHDLTQQEYNQLIQAKDHLLMSFSGYVLTRGFLQDDGIEIRLVFGIIGSNSGSKTDIVLTSGGGNYRILFDFQEL